MGEVIDQQIAQISALLEQKLRVRGRTFEAKVRKAGRRLPRAVRRDATYLVQSIALAENPKLARMVDATKLSRAHANMVRHLESIDPSIERRAAFLNLAASIAFAVLMTAILVVFVLVQRGFV
jgi:hypothetical protein